MKNPDNNQSNKANINPKGNSKKRITQANTNHSMKNQDSNQKANNDEI